jgi:hypothetical protein
MLSINFIPQKYVKRQPLLDVSGGTPTPSSMNIMFCRSSSGTSVSEHRTHSLSFINHF